jgi:phosphopantothenoylcysteine decarboxylase / phosphopantothenate---cysteine ligase
MTEPFADKEIVLGVCGSIAAYKACEIASRLKARGATVLTAMTASAQELVGSATFEAITGNRVITGLFEPLAQPEIEHIAVAQRADLFLIAPATANMIAKAACGIADDWLSTTLLATRAPRLFAPAMNTAMYEHPATQANIQLLWERGGLFVGPGDGALACGDVGPGRLIDTPAILEAAQMALHAEKDLAGKQVLITSGANHEVIDPVRFLANRSTGKMGHALALEALCRGAKVTVITGPAEHAPPHAAHTIQVETAQEMFDAVKKELATCQIFIGAAAVADYRPAAPSDKKHKRVDDDFSVALTPNPDIAAYVGAHKKAGQISVCFAAETDHLAENAEAKRVKKGADLVVANHVGGSDCAIGADASQAMILSEKTTVPTLESHTKTALAQRLFKEVAQLSA